MTNTNASRGAPRVCDQPRIRHAWWPLAIVALAALTGCGKAPEQPKSAATSAAAPAAADAKAKADADAAKAAQVKESVDIATDAYVYGYSLVTTDVTRIQMSITAAVEALRAPPNQFAHIERSPPADYRGISAPNADTLYSVSWLDLDGAWLGKIFEQSARGKT